MIKISVALALAVQAVYAVQLEQGDQFDWVFGDSDSNDDAADDGAADDGADSLAVNESDNTDVAVESAENAEGEDDAEDDDAVDEGELEVNESNN